MTPQASETETGVLVLGIETSCDETAAAVVQRASTGRGRLLSNVVRSQWEQHRPFQGVVPEIAARAHVECLDDIIAEALASAHVGLSDLDGIAVTTGPGLIGGLLVGLITAKALSLASHTPLISINHLEGHALTVGLTEDLSPPYLLLLVSGGHSQLLLVHGVGHYERLGTTIDDALGEAFDKTAKLLDLGFPGGPAVERAARGGPPRPATPADPAPDPAPGRGSAREVDAVDLDVDPPLLDVPPQIEADPIALARQVPRHLVETEVETGLPAARALREEVEAEDRFASTGRAEDEGRRAGADAAVQHPIEPLDPEADPLRLHLRGRDGRGGPLETGIDDHAVGGDLVGMPALDEGAAAMLAQQLFPAPDSAWPPVA